jgi:hypothetical protein
LESPIHPASNAVRHVVSHADLGEHRKSAPPPALTEARHSRQLRVLSNSIFFNSIASVATASRIP